MHLKGFPACLNQQIPIIEPKDTFSKTGERYFVKAISYKSDLANPYNPKICTDCPTFFVNKRDQKISQSN